MKYEIKLEVPANQRAQPVTLPNDRTQLVPYLVVKPNLTPLNFGIESSFLPDYRAQTCLNSKTHLIEQKVQLDAPSD